MEIIILLKRITCQSFDNQMTIKYNHYFKIGCHIKIIQFSTLSHFNHNHFSFENLKRLRSPAWGGREEGGHSNSGAWRCSAELQNKRLLQSSGRRGGRRWGWRTSRCSMNESGSGLFINYTLRYYGVHRARKVPCLRPLFLR